MFADDMKIYTTIKDIANSHRLQADLTKLARDWLLKFNVTKCKHIKQYNSTVYVGIEIGAIYSPDHQKFYLKKPF